MEKLIKDRYHDGILTEIRQRYGIATDKIHLLDGFESFMYEFERDSASYILRIGHSHRRSVNLIQGEVDWLNHLAAGGAGVARAILSQNQKLVESADDGQGGQFLATAFMKAPGQPVWESTWNDKPAYFETYGKLIGRIHALSKQYKLTNPAWKRPEWDDNMMLEADKWLPESEAFALQKFQEVLLHLQALPKNNESYGMNHFDAHAGNFFINDNGNITLFDFDDCCYCWYVQDIAMVIFYAAILKEDPAAFTKTFMPPFMKGYRSENHLDSAWLKEIPWLLKLREIDLYGVIHRSLDPENLDDPWSAAYMKNRKARIDNDLPVIDFDFTSLTT